MKNKIIILGSGGHAKSCCDVIEAQNKFKILGLVDKLKTKKKYQSKYRLYSEKEIKNLRKKCQYAFLGIGQILDNKIRLNLVKVLNELGFQQPIIVSPKSYVSKSAIIQSGSIIMHGAIINANVMIGKNCIINTGAIIEHDCTIGDNCHISTGSILNGGVSVGPNSFVGSRAVIKQGVVIGKNCFINSSIFLQKNLNNNLKIL